jgi:hypothetical protein
MRIGIVFSSCVSGLKSVATDRAQTPMTMRASAPPFTNEKISTMSHDQAINSLRDTFTTRQNGCLSISAFCRTWRSQTALLADLPPRYEQVMEDLLGRLEAGSLFTEESCSFSQEDLLGNLTAWLDKAQQTLAQRQPGKSDIL